MPCQRTYEKEFCRQRGIAEKTYYYWLRKLRGRAMESTPQIVPLEPCESKEDFLEIRFRGAQLRLPGNIDMNAVAALLRSIQSQC